jgi:hypothetical protein
MRQWKMWRRLFAVAAGVFALAGTASAQYQPVPPVPPGPVTPVYLPIPQAPVAGPTAGPTVPSVPALAAGSPIPGTPGSVAVVGTNGCNNCGSGRGFTMSGGYVGSNCQYGNPCNSGCGSCKADTGFIFGPCKSFFSPCGPGLHGHGNGNGLFGGGRCCPPAAIHGRGPCGPFNPCVYDSYLNH